MITLSWLLPSPLVFPVYASRSRNMSNKGTGTRTSLLAFSFLLSSRLQTSLELL
ncbi:hypothetical protein OIU74_006206 [Salix koriyanagi]|uniref:Uncharacterized protein n=1 Tax=Salix koriyanagi TaxID=2511006 RepID=A0A9Q0UDR1_9ROSI|nr:hypothetical protein OIU74_006206 [Salix koriyanagi]